MASASVSSLCGRAGSWRPTALATTPTHAALAYTANTTQGEEGRNVYIGIGTVLAIILIILLLIWIF
jgi:hypothetical protein